MVFPAIDPVFLRVGPLQFRWYGLMYVIGFILGYFIIRTEARRKKLALDNEAVADLIFYLAVGVVLGGRIGYVLFYDLTSYISNPLKIFYVWEGGMSFHGGLLGVTVAAFVFSKVRKTSFIDIGDMAAVAAPVGLGLGRIGNFINGELFGRVTSVPWGMIFPAGGPVPRHPSQIYEALLEGLLLFLLVRFISRAIDARGVAMAAFLAGYALFRSFVELFRQPDSQLGLFWGHFSMGQLLSLPVFIASVSMIVWIYMKKRKKEGRTIGKK